MARASNRDLVAAAIAVGALGLLLVLAYLTFGNREDPPPPDPASAAQEFAEAWIAGDRDALVQLLVRRPGRDLDEALSAFDDLEVTGFRVEIGEVTDGVDGIAIVRILPSMDLGTVDGATVGTWSWETDLQMQRSRSTWRVAWAFDSFHPALAKGVHFELRQSVADRASILAFDGTPLTATGALVTVGIEPRKVFDAERLGASLSTLLPEAVDELAETMARPDLQPTWFYPLATVPSSRLDTIRDRVAALPGILLREADGRVASGSSFARHLLGRVTPASAEEAAAAGVEPGTGIGRGGLEELYDAQLQGGPITEILAVEPDGDVRGTVAVFSATRTEAVVTTLDALAQEAVENAMTGRSDRSAIVLVGGDGSLLASAARPLGGYNRAFAGAYPPGAAAWPITLYAAIRDSGVDASDRVSCPGETRVGGVRFDNLGGFELGDVGLDIAVSEGCRTTVAQLAGALDAGVLESLASDLGFGTTPDLLLESAASAWPGAKDTAERAAAGVGQAKVTSSLAHLASVASAFGDGSWQPVHLLPRPDPDEGHVLQNAAWQEARALFMAAGARNNLPAGTGVVSGESTSAEGRLAWAVIMRDGLGGVVLVEQGTRQQALELARRTLAELDTLRAAAG